jgi:thiol:disulfide interchange protein DsbA
VKKLVRVATLFVMMCLSVVAWSEDLFKPGVDYKVLEQPGATDDPTKVEVREFFWFGCPHCFALESTLEEWRKQMPAGAVFVRTPPALNDAWTPHSHAFYVAELMGKGEEVTVAMFDALHVKKQSVRSEDELAAFFTRFGMTEDEFREKYNSFAVRTKVRAAKNLAMGYQLHGVPGLVINGKYFVDLALAKTNPRMMEIVNFLIAKEQAAKAG